MLNIRAFTTIPNIVVIFHVLACHFLKLHSATAWILSPGIIELRLVNEEFALRLFVIPILMANLWRMILQARLCHTDSPRRSHTFGH